jgi:PKD repeat protein
MKVRLLVSVVVVIICAEAFGQGLKDTHCGTMEMDSISRRRFPQRGTLLDFEDAVQQKIAELRALKKSGRVMSGHVSLPIIVHVVHNGEAIGSGTNISQAQVQSQIDVLNEDFRRLANTPGGSSTNPLAADIEIEFCLSPVGEDGETLAEAGIHRYNGGRSDWTTDQIENQLKPTTSWNPNIFYNIWTVKFASANASLIGYAQFPDQSGLSGLNPSGGPASTDGVVIRYQSFGSTDKGNFPVMVAPYNKGRTLTHETGHWLGLRHIWGDGACADDFVADTPPQQSPSSGCPTGRFSCNSTNMIENYMDYSNDACMNIFTEGQKTRMQAVIAVSPRRKSLIEANLCSPPPPAPPVAQFDVNNPNCVLVGSSVSFIDRSTNFPTSWNWKFEGGTPSESESQNPTIKYNTPGTYAVSLWTENALGISDTLIQEDVIVVSAEGICRDFNNFSESHTASIIKLKDFGNYTGYLTGSNSLKTQALAEFFRNDCGYLYISGMNIRFSKAYTTKPDAQVNFVVWNARGPQTAPGSVIEKKVVSFQQIQDDVINNRVTSIVFDRETPVFGKPFQVGLELVYEGDTLAITSSANGEALDATSWLKNKNGTWEKFATAFGANIAMDIEPIVGMNPSVQVSASNTIIFPGQEVVLNGRGASIFVWNSSDGSINDFTGPQLIVNPTESTTYTTIGSGLELCNNEAYTTIYVSDQITGTEETRGLILSPNPGANEIIVEFTWGYLGPVDITILTMQGNIISRDHTFKDQPTLTTKLNSSSWPSGLYLVRVKTSSQTHFKRWIKVP